MSDWQPIETAPKDGTRILVVVKENAYRSKGGRVTTATWRLNKPTVHSYWKEDGANVIAPTHWMPIPAPPNAPSPAEPKDAATVQREHFDAAFGDGQ